MRNKILKLKDNNYKKIFKYYNNKFILINFFTEWCLPCKKMKILFEKLYKDNLLESLIFCLVDIDKNPFILKKFKIKSIPTFIIIFSYNILDKRTGIIDLDEFKYFINQSISNFNKNIKYLKKI